MDAVDRFREIAFPFVRFGSFTATAILFGLVPILLLVLRPAFKGAGAEAWSAGRLRVADRIEGLIEGALIVAMTATGLFIVLQALQIAEVRGTAVDGNAISSVFDSSYGRWVGVRIPLLIALGVMLFGKARVSVLAGTEASDSGPSPVFWGIWAGLSGLLLATATFSGHSAVASPKVLAEINDIVHLAAGATWFTGIVVLAGMVPAATRDAVRPLELLRPVVTRFSQIAVVMIAVVVLTGTLNSILHVERLADFVNTGYGRAIAVKIALVLGIIGLGGVNHFVIRRRLEATPSDADSSTVRHLFKKLVVAELFVGLAIFGATGVLTDQARTKKVVVPASAGHSVPTPGVAQKD
jgi:putative copper export protein